MWAKRWTRSLATEVIPFAALSFAGLALSTVAVHLTAGWADRAAVDPWLRTGAVELANLVTFGSLWIAQSVILDHILFAGHPRARALFP